jgi:NAD(P)-dependent dehydrogenase (short-subunit alcohol dehydrogenase family)
MNLKSLPGTSTLAPDWGWASPARQSLTKEKTMNDMYRRFVGDNAENQAAVSAMHPIGRIGTSEEIADAVIWLSSAKSSFVLGHSLLVDGGWTAQ